MPDDVATASGLSPGLSKHPPCSPKNLDRFPDDVTADRQPHDRVSEAAARHRFGSAVGHRPSPYEQKTQQSPERGRITARQAGQS